MGQLLQKPDSVWAAFRQGVWWGALGIGVPLVVSGGYMIAVAKHPQVSLTSAIGTLAGIVLVGMLLMGLLNAGWRAIQLWAYARFLKGPAN